MKKNITSYLIILSFGILFMFSVSNAFAEASAKPMWITKTYCFFYPSRCVFDSSLVTSTTTIVVATSTKAGPVLTDNTGHDFAKSTKNEDKGIVTNTMSWIRSLKANKIETKLICVEDVCVNKSQFLKMVQMVNSESPVFTISFTTNNGTTTSTGTINR